MWTHEKFKLQLEGMWQTPVPGRGHGQIPETRPFGFNSGGGEFGANDQLRTST